MPLAPLSTEVEQHQSQHEIVEPTSQLEAVFASIPDGVIVYDLKGKIRRINPAALTLFELASENLCIGTSYRQFLRRYKIHDENQQPNVLKDWPISRVIRGDTASGTQEDPVMMRVPSGRDVYVIISCAPVLDSQHHRIGTVCVFHDITDRHRNELRIRQTNAALLTLLRTIADIPALVDRWSPEATLLLPPAMSFIGQRLVELIGQILGCKMVLLLSLGPPADHLYYVAMWGLTPEQERRLRENSRRFSLSDFFDEKTLAHLYANKEVSITHDRIHVPFLNRFDLGSGNILLTPILLRKQIAGILVIAKANLNDVYTSEEIALVKAVATLITLVIECVRALNKLDGTNTREFVLQETNQLINEFLNITSHELRTPLTATMGNIQLAQRRLEALKRHATDLSETLSKYIKQVQQPLENASQSAQLQEQIIRNMIDDARIQSHTLTLHMRRCNLIKLVQEVVAKRQQQAPERRIILDIRHTEETVPIIADADRIKQVIDTYLTNALNYSPGDRTVTVQLTVEGSVARVSVHDEGPGIPPEEQEHIWKRFYRAKGIAIQHELDLSLGISLYICQELIKYHHGGVGLQSVPDHGSTFWFTLPVATQQK
jgi:PAS domain S-box-containing protein